MDRILQTTTPKSRRQGSVTKLPSASWILKWYGPGACHNDARITM